MFWPEPKFETLPWKSKSKIVYKPAYSKPDTKGTRVLYNHLIHKKSTEKTKTKIETWTSKQYVEHSIFCSTIRLPSASLHFSSMYSLWHYLYHRFFPRLLITSMNEERRDCAGWISRSINLPRRFVKGVVGGLKPYLFTHQNPINAIISWIISWTISWQIIPYQIERWL